MSLALYASPFNNNDMNDNQNNYSNDSNDSTMGKKKIHNKTIRKVNKNENKVNSILEEIHNSNIEEDENNLGDFNPPPKPDSAGVNKTIATEQANNLLKQKNTEMFSIMNAQVPQGMSSSNDDQLLMNSYNNNANNKESVDNYYKSVLPNYQSNNINKQYYQSGYQTSPSSNIIMDSNQDILLQKLNYVIHLLEEKQDEKTNNVMEEVILYSFLGIFIIFVIDSFSKTGKYSR
jgi:hypothetical protein